MNHDEFSFLSLLIITGLAAFVPLLATRLYRFRLPIVVGEIMAGVVIGKSGFDLIEPSAALEFLTIFGFTYLMFISGLEVDFEILTTTENGARQGRLASPITLGLVIFSLTVGLAFLAAEGLLRLGLVQEPFMIALILSTTSLGIVVPVLKERRLMAGRYGQTLLMSALIADFGTLVLITVDVVILSQGLTFEVLLVLLLLAAFAVAVRLGKLVAGIPGLPHLIEELSHATAQIRVRGAMALMVAFIVLSEWLGTEVILGAFLAGAVISLLAGRDSGSDLYPKMDAMGFGFFIPIFFIMVGVNFDLPALLESSEALLLVPLLLGIAYVVKFAAALLYRLHFSWRETFAAGGLLSARLSLIIAAAAIALELGIITEAVDAAIILVAIVTCTISPLLFNRILPRQPGDTRRGVIVVGLGEMPSLLAERLLQSGEPVVMIGLDRGRKRQKRRQDLPVLEGDPTRPETLAAVGAGRTAALVAMSTYDEVNLTVCRLARDQFDIPQLVAQASDPHIGRQMSDLGVHVIQPQFATMLAVEGALRFPAAFEILTHHVEGVDIREVALSNPSYYNKPLRHVRLPGDALVLGLRRKGEVLVPHGNTKLRQGDLLMLIGRRDSLQQAMSRLTVLQGERAEGEPSTKLNETVTLDDSR